MVGEAEALEEEAPWDRKEFMLSIEASRAPGIRNSTSEEPTTVREGNKHMAHGISFTNAKKVMKTTKL